MGCSNEDSTDSNLNIENSITQDLTGVFNLFPLIENPEFDNISNVDLNGSVLVGMVNFGSEIRIYPHPYIVRYEVINDEYQGRKFAFSYCPITKSSLAFTRDQLFRASGYLYKDNVTPWDQKTETIWSQMLVRGIIGEEKNKKFNTIPVIETTWSTAKQYFPKAKVITSNLIASKEPDGGGNDSNSENSPELSDLVYGIIDNLDNVHIFKYSDFSGNKKIGVKIRSQNYIVFGDPSKHIINAFKVSFFEDFETLEDDEFPFILQNTNGVKYDVFGRGENGSVLEKPSYAYVARWRAWEDFYSNFTFQE